VNYASPDQARPGKNQLVVGFLMPVYSDIGHFLPLGAEQ
jgi:hypothetical protein